MIFREMSRKLKSPRAAAEEDKKRKDQHEDSDEALVDRERGGGERGSIAQGKKCVHRRRARCACGYHVTPPRPTR